MTFATLNDNAVLNKVINNNIRELRNKLGMTQQVFAEAIGSSRSTIAQIESGSQEPTYAQLLSISTKFDISIDILSGKLTSPISETQTVNEDPVQYKSSNVEYKILELENRSLKREIELLNEIIRILKSK